MAGGYSLIDGITVKEKRNDYLDNYDSTSMIAYIGGTTGTKNKFYPIAFGRPSFENGIVDTDFVVDFNCYYSWFNPNDNTEDVYVYTYKVSDGYIVYIHTFIDIDKVAVVLPPYLEGMRFDSMVEKTDGATLLTNVVSCNKLYAKFEEFGGNRLDNYLVFKVK